MGIVRERRRVIGTLRDSDVKWTGDSDHIPSALRRIAVGVAASDFGGRNFSARQLRLGKVSGQSRLLHGFARVGFGFGFPMSERKSGERIFVQPGDRIIEIENVVGFLGVFFREQGIDLVAQSFRIEIGGGQAESFREFRQRRDAMVCGKRHPHIGHPDLMTEEVEEIR